MAGVCLYDERACEICVAKYRTGREASFQLLKGAFCFFVPFLRESSTVCWFRCSAFLLPLNSRRDFESMQWRSDLGEPWHKATVVSSQAHERLELLGCCRCIPVKLSGSIATPSADTTCPIYFTFFRKNWHLFGFTRSPCSLKRVNNMCSLCSISSYVCENTNISSR